MRPLRSLLLPTLLLASGACAPKAVRPKAVLLCRGARCETVSDAASRARLLDGLHGLLREAKGRDVSLHSVERGSGAEKKHGISFFVQGGPIPGRSTITGVRVIDVLFIDRQKAEAKARMKVSATYLSVPLLCTESAATLVVTSEQAGLTLSNVCTWIGAGTTKTNIEFLFDRVDLESGVATGNWSARTAGLPVIGGGSGYMAMHLRAPAKPAPAASVPAPAVKAPVPVLEPAPQPVAASAEVVEIVSRAIKLKLSTQLKDADGDLLLEGGERVSVEVVVENVGQILASGVRVSLSGEAALVQCLGDGRGLGTIIPGERQTLNLECRLPAQVPSETVSLRFVVTAGAKGETAATKVLKIGMKPAVVEAEEVVSELSVDEIPARTGKDAGADNVALVVGLGRYRDKSIPAVKYAARDAEVVARYLESVAGVAPANLKLLTDDAVTKSDLEAYIEDWLPRRVGPQSTVILYYSGHGTPDVAGKEGFIVPYEGHADFPSKLYSLQRMYESLAKLPAKAVIVLLDSCFSGAKGRGITKEGARPLVSVVANAPPAGARVFVIAGATGSQIASDFDRVEHGLFTYFLLKGLRGEADADRDGVVTLGEIFPFISGGVTTTASSELNRDQTPVLLGEVAAHAKLPVARAAR